MLLKCGSKDLNPHLMLPKEVSVLPPMQHMDTSAQYDYCPLDFLKYFESKIGCFIKLRRDYTHYLQPPSRFPQPCWVDLDTNSYSDR